ncbi:biopolymer transport protein ExbB/TolQ [Pedobacter sp. AK017]|uniref:hypothetical protein n=1 Tax=Pedobacter sp. AK017 TaxID=2723073 RepID=UPI001616F749|nr:hypothetical protein [Pedobacter sp. AK017]MBB5438118.1 biopolymer transport protein ExbB/TolQ [Pedobacter sp. AK017]
MASLQKVSFVSWILVLILVMSLFIVAYFFNLWPSQRAKKIELRAPEVRLLEKRENSVTVNDYIKYVQENPEKMTLDHDFLNKALLKLSVAINTMAKTINYKLTG